MQLLIFCLNISYVSQALWTMENRDITDDMHEDFYKFISNSFDKPRYKLHYKADAPLNIRALFYVPEYKPSKAIYVHVRIAFSSITWRNDIW